MRTTRILAAVPAAMLSTATYRSQQLLPATIALRDQAASEFQACASRIADFLSILEFLMQSDAIHAHGCAVISMGVVRKYYIRVASRFWRYAHRLQVVTRSRPSTAAHWSGPNTGSGCRNSATDGGAHLDRKAQNGRAWHRLGSTLLDVEKRRRVRLHPSSRRLCPAFLHAAKVRSQPTPE
jgi:hypothetical protein